MGLFWKARSQIRAIRAGSGQRVDAVAAENRLADTPSFLGGVMAIHRAPRLLRKWM